MPTQQTRFQNGSAAASASKDAEGFYEGIEVFARTELSSALFSGPDKSFPVNAWRLCGKRGIMGLPVSTEHGGCGFTALETAKCLEAIGYGCEDNGFITAICAHLLSCVVPLWQRGSAAQKEKYLPNLCNGEWVAGHVATEPTAGSDIFSMRTRAERRGDIYVINGDKAYCLSAPVADVYFVFANLAPDFSSNGITLFLVDRGTPGLELEHTVQKIGLKTATMGNLKLRNCQVPVTNRIGPEGSGTLIFHLAMRWERTLIIAPQVGTMRRTLEKAIAYARERHQFGQSIGKFQSVSNRLVDMKVRLELARLMLYHAAHVLDQGRRDSAEPSIAKLFLSEAALANHMDALRIHGAQGFTEDMEFGNDVTDTIGLTILSGTSDIQRQIIAKHLGL
jgi:L-prolyl-PCP dehydrogenase